MKSSECHKYRETVAALVLGELPGDQVSAVEQHLKTCPTCGVLYRALQQEEQILRSTFQVIVDRIEAQEDPLIQSLTESRHTDASTPSKILAIGRYIMSSKLTQFTVAAIVVIGLLVGLQYFTGSVDPASVAWADVREALLAQQWVHLAYDNGKEEWYDLVEGKNYYKDWDGSCMSLDWVRKVRQAYRPTGGTFILEDRPVIHHPSGVIPPWKPTTAWDAIVGHAEKVSKNGAQGNWEAEQHVEKKDTHTLLRFDSYYTDAVGRRLLVTQLWADPKTRLPVKKCERLSLADRNQQNREFITGTFAFPSSGPGSLQDLGVPQGTPIVKDYKIPDASVTDIVKRVKDALGRFPAHYRALRYRKGPGAVIGLIWRSDRKIRYNRYPNHHLDLPAPADHIFQWTQTQSPNFVDLFDGERQCRLGYDIVDNKIDPPQAHVMRASKDLMVSQGKPIEEQWKPAFAKPSQLLIIDDAPEVMSRYIGLRSERGDERREFYVDPEHDYICVHCIWWKHRSGQWEKKREFKYTGFERLPQGQWYATQHIEDVYDDQGHRYIDTHWNIHVTVLQENEFPPDTFNTEKLLEGAVMETY